MKSLHIFIIVASVFGILLMISEFILLNTLAKEIDRSSLVFKTSISVSQNKVNDINNKLILLEAIQKDFVRWSNIFDYISQKTPEGISFNKITISKDGPSIAFSGFSKTRENLLSLKDFLENSEVFEKVEFPVQNLLQKENISFEIKSKIKVYEIK